MGLFSRFWRAGRQAPHIEGKRDLDFQGYCATKRRELKATRQVYDAHCPRGCTEFTPHTEAVGVDIFTYTTCPCGTWYMAPEERRRFGDAQEREAKRRGLWTPVAPPHTED